jgi:histidyl-tRNA synthetase
LGEPIHPVRGMNDVLPEAIGAWQYFESCTREVLTAY